MAGPSSTLPGLRGPGVAAPPGVREREEVWAMVRLLGLG